MTQGDRDGLSICLTVALKEISLEAGYWHQWKHLSEDNHNFHEWFGVGKHFSAGGEEEVFQNPFTS